MNSTASIPTAPTEPDFICVPKIRWQELRGESGRLQSNCESMSLALMTTGHDLRQGLHVLLGCTDKLASSVQLPADRELIQGMKELVRGLANDFENLALLAAVTTTGCSAPLIDEVSVRPILLDACARWRFEAQQKGLDLRVASHDVLALTNAHWLAVILRNLIGNAVRHTPDGEVSIESMLRNTDWVLTVRDSGPGINDTELGRAFNSAAQPRIRGGGLGLGLAIVRRAVALLGHGLDISSTPTKGTTICLRIAVAETKSRANQPCANQFLDAT
jgi:signal transduction histidine kinase